MSESSFEAFVLDQLADLEDLTSRAMFGGYGLYQGETFFGIIHADSLYLKVDDETRPDFEAAGMGPFQPNKRQTMQGYYEVPPEVLEDPEALVAWAQRAVEAEP